MTIPPPPPLLPPPVGGLVFVGAGAGAWVRSDSGVRAGAVVAGGGV
ncbi:hypothetical protein [Streptomyces sp. NBC_00091]|nr:hypothetical protein [Streptomyces sp. NBC_00091]MCX5377806.1 hypothetical protein [Streptomyces sp. NBC_00091]